MRFNDTTNVVKEILFDDKCSRNSNDVLYLRVIQRICSDNGINADNMSVPMLFLNVYGLNIPSYESVVRTRRKLQECYPSLRATENVEAQRMVMEEKYREYGRKAMV